MAAKGATPEQIGMWKDAYESGLSFKEVARKYGVDATTVRRRLKDKVEVRDKGTSKETVDEWYRLYTDGVSKTAIAKKYKVSCSTVSRVLAREKGIKRERQGKRVFEHLLPTFKRMYESGFDLRDISNETKASPQTVLNYLNEEGVTIRTYSESLRTYEVKEDYFDVIDSERKAYVLGLIFASGTLLDHRNSYSLQIIANTREVNVIQEIFGELTNKPNESIWFSVTDNCYKDRIFSKKIYDRLKELGLGLKNEIRMPDIDKKYNKSFLKGHLVVSATLYVKQNDIRVGCRPNMVGALRDLVVQCVRVAPEAILTSSSIGNAFLVCRNAEVEKIKDFMKGTGW